MSRIQGGWLVEAVGGPFDGDKLFHPYGESQIDVYHFNDPHRTPTVSRIGKPFGSHHLGWYSGLGADLDHHPRVFWSAA